ncbi:MAG: SIS domain-containing protein [Clostridia bacterium]|nr:SIS domain-containing protein [Clostridia bacterium]HXK71867.1 SIS domain-containing protein [Clostridia bacterium]
MKRESLEVFEEMLTSYPSLVRCKADIMRAFEIMEETYKYGKILLICGNGGSSSDAEHIVGELMKGFKKKRHVEPNPRLDESIRENLSEGLPAICLSSHTSLITAIGNDSSYDMIYAQQAYAYRKLAGAILCLSTSGNARNVNNAAITARACRIPVIGMTGELGGYLNSLADVCIKVPESETYKVQELHLPVYHCLCAMLECEFFEN